MVRPESKQPLRSSDVESGPFVAVSGSVATGKSGLVDRLSSILGAERLPEDVAENPYFDRFYENPARWAFHSQTSFALDSLKRHLLALGEGAVVQDRTVYETVEVFSRLLHRLGHLSDDDFSMLSEISECARALPRQPTLLVYLHAPVPVLIERIAKRDRLPERHLTHSYLTELDKTYGQFVDRWDHCPVLRVDSGAHDLRPPEGIQHILDEVERTA